MPSSLAVRMLVLNEFTHDARVQREAKALAAANHNVTVVALWKAGLKREEERDGYRVVRLHLRSRGWRSRLVAPLVKYVEYAFRVGQLPDSRSVQVYHAHAVQTLPAAWLATRGRGHRLVYDAHELETGHNFHGFRLAGIYRHVWPWPERAFIRSADATITVNEGIADELVRLYGIADPVVVMNCPERQPFNKSTRLRDELGIPPGLKIALYQGGVVGGRGIEPFLYAIQRLPEVAGVVLGDGHLLEEYRARAESGLWQRVYLPGKVPLDDLPHYTASADVGVTLIQDICRSYHLALPNKLFEYLQAGIPVLGSNLPEIARIIQGYNVGLVVDPDDPDAIAEALGRLLRDTDLYARSSAKARQAAAIFNWDREKVKLLDLYQNLGK